MKSEGVTTPFVHSTHNPHPKYFWNMSQNHLRIAVKSEKEQNDVNICSTEIDAICILFFALSGHSPDSQWEIYLKPFATKNQFTNSRRLRKDLTNKR